MKLMDELNKRGWSQRELAYRSGIAVPLINGFCRGARPCLRNALRVAKTLEIEPEALWGSQLQTFMKNR